MNRHRIDAFAREENSPPRHWLDGSDSLIGKIRQQMSIGSSREDSGVRETTLDVFRMDDQEWENTQRQCNESSPALVLCVARSFNAETIQD